MLWFESESIFFIIFIVFCLTSSLILNFHFIYSKFGKRLWKLLKNICKKHMEVWGVLLPDKLMDIWTNKHTFSILQLLAAKLQDIFHTSGGGGRGKQNVKKSTLFLKASLSCRKEDPVWWRPEQDLDPNKRLIDTALKCFHHQLQDVCL